MAELPPGTRVGAYRVLSVLGRGGMGVVYEAEDARGGRVAVKVVSRELASSPDFLARFRREGTAQAAIVHANVVAFVESGEENGMPFLVSELVRGGSLKERLRERGRLEWRDAASLGVGIARGLGAIHAAGLVHRDLKPENVLLADDGHGGPPHQPKVSDFGLVGAATASLAVSRSLTRTGEVLGTLAYMAPEQANAEATITASADLYSLGAVLYALVTGSPPFEGTGYSLMKKHLLERPTPPRELVPGLPASFERLVLSLLEKKPGQRPPTALAVANELEAILRREPVEPTATPALRRSRAWLGLGAALLALAVGGAVVWALAESRREEAARLAAKAALLLDEDRDYRETIRVASQALELDPGCRLALDKRGVARGNSGDLEGGIADLTAAIDLDASDEAAWMNRGALREQRGEADGAIADLTRAIELDPRDFHAWINRATIRDKKGAFDAAVADETKAIELDRNRALGWARRGGSRQKKGDLEGAIEDLSRAIELDPKDALAWHERGSARSKRNDREGALADIARAIELDPENGHYWGGRALVKLQGNDLAGAIADATRGIALAPQAPSSWQSRGIARYQSGDFAGATSDLERVVALSPRDAASWGDLGAARGQLGDLNGALAALVKATELDPRDGTSWRNRGTAHLNKGELDPAVASFTKAVDLEPRDTDSLRFRGVAKQRSGDREGAIADYVRFLERAPNDSNVPEVRLALESLGAR